MEQRNEGEATVTGHGHHGEGSGGPNVPATVAVGVIGAILLFVLVVVLQAVFYRAQEAERQAKVVAVPSEELVQLRSEQEALLGSYRWIDQANGVVGIPIERAMELEAAGR